MTHQTIEIPIAQRSIAALVEQGFSPVEINRLLELRASWNPAVEQVGSLQDWRRIQFAKWLYERGHYTDEIGGEPCSGESAHQNSTT